MALSNFVPEVWAATLLRNLNKSFVYTQAGVVNRNFEGEVSSFGDTVRINAIGAITVSDYTKDTDILTPSALTDAQTILSINQAKYFNFAVDDIDKAQQNPKVMNEAMYEAGIALANATDQYVAGLMVSDAKSTIGTTAAPQTDLATLGKAYEYLVDLKVKLDAENVPMMDRWVIVPPWYHGYLLKDQRFVSFGTQQNADILANGAVGRASGFDILISNNVVNTGLIKYKIVAGHGMATTFADQISKVEAYRPPLRFADAMKGLHVYGARVAKPAALAVLTANPT